MLRRRLGLQLTSLGPTTLERAVQRRMRAQHIEDWEEYAQYLKCHPTELDALVEEVVVPETWFFRDQAYFDALAELLLHPPFCSAAPLRVLSVPCATGEEAYSIAITLLSSGRTKNDFQVVGVDVSQHAVARAEEALYGRRSFRGTDEEFQRTYFHAEGDLFRLVTRVRQTVSFRRGNVIDSLFMGGLGQFHVIFCKNLLIYLCGWARQRAAEQLRRLLTPEGRLFAGTAEISLFLDHGFAAVSERYPFLLAPAAIPGRERRAPRRPPAAPPSSTSQQSAARLSPATAPPPPVRETVIEQARRLADRGDLDHARKLLENDSLPATAERYHLLGVVAKAAGDTTAAQEFLKRALYLDPHHTESLHLLAMLAETDGDLRAARGYRRRLQELAPSSDLGA